MQAAVVSKTASTASGVYGGVFNSVLNKLVGFVGQILQSDVEPVVEAASDLYTAVTAPVL